MPQVHVVPGRLHPGEERRHQEVARVAGVPGQREAGTRAGFGRPVHDAVRSVRNQLSGHFSD